jgi:hypothetical protein
MGSTNYQEYVVTFAPGFLLKTWGKKFLQGIAKVLDSELVDRAKESVKAHIIEVAPDSALATLGRERQLEKYPPMSLATYRSYLQAAWEVWPGGGTEGGLLAALSAALPGPTYEIWEQIDGGPFTYDGWSSFYVLLRDPIPWDFWQYGTDRTWGEKESTWGSTATPAEIKFLRQLIKKWKGGHNKLEGIALNLSSMLIWPGTPEIEV